MADTHFEAAGDHRAVGEAPYARSRLAETHFESAETRRAIAETHFESAETLRAPAERRLRSAETSARLPRGAFALPRP